MKSCRRYLIVFGALFMVGGPLKAEPFLRLVQPYDNSDIPYVEKSFVFGSVKPATATLTINGFPVTPYRNGAFFTIIPFEEGDFKITAVADDGTSSMTVTQMVHVNEGLKTLEENDTKMKALSPSGRVVLRTGDTVHLAFHGPPNGRAYFRIAGRSGTYPMKEQEGDVAGIYRGVYEIQSTDKFDKSRISFGLKRRDGRRLAMRTRASLSVQRRRIPRIIELRRDAVVLTGPGSNFGYYLFIKEGVRLPVTGEWGGFYRVGLGRRYEGWVKKSLSKQLPIGTPISRSVSRNARIDVTATSTLLIIPLKNRHAHRIQQFIDPYRIRLSLYGVVADTDRIRFIRSDSAIEEISWSQEDPETMVLDIETKQKYAWGYDVRYEDDNTFILEIRHEPKRSGGMKGMTIAVDAGHSRNNFGTIGPLGNTEASVVLSVARLVKEEFESRGANVVMIQDGTRELTLNERVEAAWDKRADLYISLHADASGEGTDPREIHGYSVHYFHPQSQLFAKTVHRMYGEAFDIPDRGLWRSNLAVCRTPQMPSILLEMAFLILPKYEELLISERFQTSVADKLADSIIAFMNEAQ